MELVNNILTASRTNQILDLHFTTLRVIPSHFNWQLTRFIHTANLIQHVNVKFIRHVTHK